MWGASLMFSYSIFFCVAQSPEQRVNNNNVIIVNFTGQIYIFNSFTTFNLFDYYCIS
jgi:hypothetical protein